MQEPGFELTFPDETEATFVPFTVSMTGAKDLQIIDRCTRMPLDEFAEAFDDPFQRGRGPIMLAMIGLSIRAKFPDWSVERIMRIVDVLELPDVAFIGGEDQNGTDPLTQEPNASGDDANSGSPSDASESSATPTETSAPETTPSISETSSETPD